MKPPKSTSTKDNTKQDWNYIKRLFGYLKGEHITLLLTAVALIVYGFGSAYAPTLIAKAIDNHITEADYEGLATVMLTLLTVYILMLIGFRSQLMLLGKLGQRVLVKLRSDIFKKMQALPLQFYHDNDPGDLMSRMINDTSVVGELFSQSIAQNLGSIISLVSIIIAMFFLDWRLAIASFLVIPIMLYLTFYFSKKSRKAFAVSSKSLGTLSTNIEQDLRLIRETQAFVREEINIEQFRTSNAFNRDANIEAIRITAAFSPSINILSTLAQVIVIGFGGYLAFHDLTTVGVLVAFLTYVQRFFRPIQMLAEFYTELQAIMASSERIFTIIDHAPEDQSEEIKILPLGEVQGEVSFNHVYFGYNNDQIVLKDLNFLVKPGESVAFIGETGVGKSTSINLIPRYYEVNEGSITLDDRDINTIPLPQLRKHIAEVPQSSFLFTDTVANNISFGDASPNREKVIEAANVAQAHEFISRLPKGYDTIIGSEYGSLSQGEMQLLCIARAIYADPKILLLDEATSSIDTATEKKVQKAVDQVLKDRTSFVIAHRLSTIKNVDKIIVLGKEGVLEMGNHNELLEKDGYYSKILNQQVLNS